MGGGSSLPALEPLERLSGAAPISADDAELWQALTSLQLPSEGVVSAEQLRSASHDFCARMVQHNLRSGNLRTLIRYTIDVLLTAQRPRPPSHAYAQSANCLFLLRIFLKHCIETLEPAALVDHLTMRPEEGGGGQRGEVLLAGPLVEALLTALVQVELTDDSYWLHMELAAALTVCMSTQMFAPLTDPTPQPLLSHVLTSGGPGAELLVARLIGHVIARPPPPLPAAGLLRRLGRGVKTVLLLPYYSLAYLFSSASTSDDAPLALADRAILLLLLLTQHMPPALFGDAAGASAPSNPFLDALRELGDTQPFDVGASPAAAEGTRGVGGDPERGQIRKHTVSFRELHDAICAQLPEQSAALLLYLMLHGNRDYLDYCLSRTDPDTVLLPLLQVLHDSKSLTVNRLYMLLILLLMLSQDAGFVGATQSAMVVAPWYKTRILGGTVSLGSLLVMLLTRTVQTNLAGVHDAYVHTNCLAALANVAPLLRKLHPHAARCMISLIDLFSRKFLKHSRLALHAGGAEGDSARSEEGAEGDGGGEAVQMAVDFLRIALEAINLCLTANPALNEHLVYALLERQTVFAPLREHELFSDLVVNIDLVLEHFGATLRAEPSQPQGGSDQVWSVDTVLTHIRDAAREWRADSLRPLPDLKFTYEQEPAPEEFFTPYVWSIVFDRAAIDWNPERVTLFAVAARSAHTDAEGADASLPALSSIDVDESATG